jgi:hypothetical protein
MFLLSRQFICNRLRLERRSSYRIIGASQMSLVNSDDVLDIINVARRGIDNPLKTIPSDLRTPEEMASEIKGVTAEILLNWTQRRTKNVPPHFRFNKQTTRFSAKLLKDWLNERSKVCKIRIA